MQLKPSNKHFTNIWSNQVEMHQVGKETHGPKCLVQVVRHFQGQNIIKRKLDKWEDRFSTKMFKCRGSNEKKYLKVYDICASGCRFKNSYVNDKMYIGKMEVLLNFGEKEISLFSNT